MQGLTTTQMVVEWHWRIFRMTGQQKKEKMAE